MIDGGDAFEGEDTAQSWSDQSIALDPPGRR